ncbi:MAG TPA: DUF4157 domain-containing protein, partial [Bryobacteraceae bacterium]|nr:DUF4157 domain-containing protein [Bryobacteraceae bacterium]
MLKVIKFAAAMFAPPTAQSKTKAVAGAAHEFGQKSSTPKSSETLKYGYGDGGDARDARETAGQVEDAPHRLTWDFSTIPLIAPQANLMVGSVNDPLEREADRIADRVVQMESAPPALQAAPVQVQRKCAACENEEEETLRRKSAGAGGHISAAGVAPPSVAAALAGPGRKMDSATRSFFEPRFGRSLGDVRIHSDATAARSAEAVSARAYTVGRDIVFAPGQYSPGTPRGRWLLAHEIAHIQQQSGSRHGSAPASPVVRRQAGDGKMIPKVVPTTPSPAPAAGAAPVQSAAPPTAPDLGSQDPSHGKLAPAEQPAQR